MLELIKSFIPHSPMLELMILLGGSLRFPAIIRDQTWLWTLFLKISILTKISIYWELLTKLWTLMLLTNMITNLKTSISNVSLSRCSISEKKDQFLNGYSLECYHWSTSISSISTNTIQMKITSRFPTHPHLIILILKILMILILSATTIPRKENILETPVSSEISGSMSSMERRSTEDSRELISLFQISERL